MCSFSALRTRLFIAFALIVLSLASAAVALSLAWNPYAWGPCFWAAATWTTAAFIFIAVSVQPALSAFCDCAKAIPACALACKSLSDWLTLLYGLLFSLWLLCVCLALAGPIGLLGTLLVVGLLAALSTLLLFYWIWASQLASCQSSVPAAPKDPTTPQPGPGPIPM